MAGSKSGWEPVRADTIVPPEAATASGPIGLDRRRGLLSAALIIAGTVAVAVVVGREFLDVRRPDTVFPGDGVTSVRRLSDWFTPLLGTPGDTEVFILEGEEPGPTALILGGVHPNEPAGMLTAVLLVENARAIKGRVLVVPWANASGFSHSDYQEGSPQRFSIATPGGPRRFRLGSRVTNAVHQWPDPVLHVNPGGQRLAGVESRNLNRAFPGKAHGNLTERIAWGIMEVIRQEGVTIGVDLHESAPEYPVINAIVFHENSAEMAAVAQMELQMEGYEFRLEASPPNLRGLSHREWGDAAGIRAVLFETPNASHGRLKGRPSEELIVEGRDKYYPKAAALGRLFVPYPVEGVPLKHRVARHLAAIRAVFAALAELEPEGGPLEIIGMPSAGDVEGQGIGAFLHPPAGRLER